MYYVTTWVKSGDSNFQAIDFVEEFRTLDDAKSFADHELELDEEGTVIQYSEVCDEDNIILHTSEGTQ